MNKLIIICIFTLGTMTLLAEESKDLAARRAKMRERRERVYRNTGGTIVKPGSQRGKIRFVSSVPSVGKSVLEKQYMPFKQYYPFDMEAINGNAVTLENAGAEKARLGLSIAIFIVDASFSAPMIAAPEEGWAIVNNSACGTPERTAKEAIKAFAVVAGAANSRFGVTFLSSTHPRELDSVDVVEIPVDVAESILKQLRLVNVTPQSKAHYNIAVQQGWAPAPTNDVQKAIWNKVHAIPAEPIKIKYEKKK